MKTRTILVLTLTFLSMTGVIAQQVETTRPANPATKSQNKPDTITGHVFVNHGKPVTSHPEKGFINYTQAGIGVRMGLPVFSISMVNGYRFSRVISLGMGAGFLHTNYPIWSYRNFMTAEIHKSEHGVGVNQINFYIEPRLYAGQTNSAPFFFFGFGYSLALPNEHELTSEESAEWIQENGSSYNPLVKVSYKAGIFSAPGVGLKTYISSNLYFNFSLQLNIAMYSITNTNRDEYGYETVYSEPFKINLIPLFHAGIGF